MKTHFDKESWIVVFCAASALFGACVALPIHAQTASATATTQTTPATSPAPMAANAADDDGDGDELLQHWSNPKYSHEQRLQLGGMLVLFVAAGIAAARRKTLIRRHPHA